MKTRFSKRKIRQEVARLWSPGKPEPPPLFPVIDALRLAPNNVVAEFGAGDGELGLLVATALAKLKGTGILYVCDPSISVLDEFEGRAEKLGLKERIQTIPLGGVPEGLIPLDDNLLDRLYAVNSVQYLDDRVTICEEIKRVLKPGGFALVIDWHQGDSQNDPVQTDTRLVARSLLLNLEQEGLHTHVNLAFLPNFWAILAKRPIESRMEVSVLQRTY